ncbi:unnamed protein product, partial [Prorocentrum cordatum]
PLAGLRRPEGPAGCPGQQRGQASRVRDHAHRPLDRRPLPRGHRREHHGGVLPHQVQEDLRDRPGLPPRQRLQRLPEGGREQADLREDLGAHQVAPLGPGRHRAPHLLRAEVSGPSSPLLGRCRGAET